MKDDIDISFVYMRAVSQCPAMESFQNKILPVQSCQLVEDLTTAIKNNDVYYFTKFFSKSLNREKNEGGFTLLQEAIRHNR